jgi:hypothetical protein
VRSWDAEWMSIELVDSYGEICFARAAISRQNHLVFIKHLLIPVIIIYATVIMGYIPLMDNHSG